MLERIKETIQYLLDNGPIDHNRGICCNFRELWKIDNADYSEMHYHKIVALVGACALDWPYFSGYVMYPINAYPTVSSCRDEYEDGIIPKWSGQALKHRTHLLKHILTTLEKEPEKCLRIFTTGD